MGTTRQTASHRSSHIHFDGDGIPSWSTCGWGALHLPSHHFGDRGLQPAKTWPQLNSGHPAWAYEVSTHNDLDHDCIGGDALKTA